MAHRFTTFCKTGFAACPLIACKHYRELTGSYKQLLVVHVECAVMHAHVHLRVVHVHVMHVDVMRVL